MVTFFDPNRQKDISYYIDKRLQRNLDKIKNKLAMKDKDYVMIVDGREGSGKSTLAIQIGKYIDPTLNVSRICMNPEEFRLAIFAAGKGQCVIYDEAFGGLSSRGALTEINKILVSLVQQMRQKNLLVIVVLPSFFMLEKYIAIFRANALLHIQEKNEKHFFYAFDYKKKKMLYLKGLKFMNYSTVRTDFHGRFFGICALGQEGDAEYRKKKGTALEATEFKKKKEKESVRNDIIRIFAKEYNLGGAKLSKLFEKYGLDLSKPQINKIIIGEE